MPYLPPNAELIETPGFDISGQPIMPGTGQPAGLRYRTLEEINSLLDLMNDQILSSGIPAGAGGFAGDSGMTGDPKNWKLTRGDLESPLSYLAVQGTSPW